MSYKVIVIGCALLSVATSVRGQGWVEGGNIVRERGTVTVHIRDQVASVEVEEWFRNRGASPGEGDYMFPMPAGAVFTSYSLFQGDNELRGEVLDAVQARRVYEEIVRRRKDPALIEMVGHGLIRARVFPIAAGESRRVIMRYTQPLQRAGDALEFRYPAQRKNDATAVALTLTVDNAGIYRDAVSPTHAVLVRREAGAMVVQPQSKLQSDFDVLLPLAERDVGIAMTTHKDGSDDGFFMLRLTPGQVAEAVRVPRDITVVLDVSGSMAGEKIDQAKAALRQLLGTLGTEDRFRLIKFNGESTEWRDDWTRAASTEVRDANRWVDDLKADGGTNIGEALADAFRAVTPSGRLPVVVFLTDGLPSVGEQDPERIAAIAEKSSNGARVFAFGVGHDVNTYLLDRLGAAGRGSAQYVQPGESVETALGVLSARIRYPVLTDLTLSASGVSLREIYPITMPDLFAGEDLVVFGRYRMNNSSSPGGPRVHTDAVGSSVGGTVTITGQRSGKAERYAARVAFSNGEDGNDYMPRLWASRKLGELSRRVRLEGSSAELMGEIKSTALRYGLLSEYTSYFVSEPDALIITGGRNPLVPRDQVSSRSIVVGGTASRGAAGGKAMPAAPTTGSAAVAVAEDARKQREVAQTTDLDAQQKTAANRLMGEVPANGLAQVDVATGGPSDPAAGARQVVAGRTFVRADSIWVDADVDPRRKIVDLVAYSDAYFDVLRALPELRMYSPLGDVAIAGTSVTIRIRAARDARPGITKMTDTEVGVLVTQFRGVAR